MKIVIATEAYWPLIDGGAVAEHHLALELARRGHEVHVLAPSESWKSWTQSDCGTTIHRLASHAIPLVKNEHRLAWRPRRAINAILARVRPDVVHIHNPFPIGRATLAYCQKQGIPVVATNHWLPENLTGFAAKFRFLSDVQFLVDMNWRWIVDFHNRCQFVTSPTQTAIDLMVRRGLVVPHRPNSNGVDRKVFHPGKSPTWLRERLGLPDKPTVLYAGRLSGEKQVDVLIRAIPRILETVDAHFILGGSGREKDFLKALARKLHIYDHVTFPGFLEVNDYRTLFRCADVFVMPSVCELQSITTLEAMASGLPVVASEKYALPELVEHGVNGYLFEPGNSSQLADFVSAILSHDKQRKAMGEESSRKVEAHSLADSISGYESIYVRLSDAKHGSEKVLQRSI